MQSVSFAPADAGLYRHRVAEKRLVTTITQQRRSNYENNKDRKCL